MSGPARRDERGFVLSLVIFAVAALSIAGTALFIVVQSESAMADSGAESSNAYHLARAGLARYMGESIGEPRPTKVYTMGGGTVTVTAERVMAASPTEDVYLITSSAEVADRRRPALAARRSVRQFAHLDRQPFDVVGAFSYPSNDINVGDRARIGGVDQAEASTCATAGTPAAGVAAVRDGVDFRGDDVSGNPPVIYAGSRDELLDRLGVDWELLTDPATPFDYELPGDGWPYMAMVLADEYPTIRVTGDFTASWLRSGRGLLVVDGEIRFGDGFNWDGTIIAADIYSSIRNDFTIDGALLVGFEADRRANVAFRGRADIQFDSCKVLEAAEGIATFSPMSNTWWEPRG